jgi:hypothetical protein
LVAALLVGPCRAASLCDQPALLDPAGDDLGVDPEQRGQTAGGVVIGILGRGTDPLQPDGDRGLGPDEPGFPQPLPQRRWAEVGVLGGVSPNRRKFRWPGFRSSNTPTSGNFPVLDGWRGAIR